MHVKYIKALRYKKNNNTLLDKRVSIMKKTIEILINVSISVQYLYFAVAAIRSEESYVWQCKFCRSNQMLLLLWIIITISTMSQ